MNSSEESLLDGRYCRPIFIEVDGKKTYALSDGKGGVYKTYDDDEHYMGIGCECLPENKYEKGDYRFIRGLTGFDF